MHELSLILVAIYYIIAVMIVVHVVMDNRQPAKTMAWALVIWFVPVAGIVFYLFFGRNTRKERLVSQRSLDQLSKRSMLEFVEQQNLRLPDEHKPVIDLFINQSFVLPFMDSEVRLYTSGYEFFPALLHEIGRARNHIHIDIYIFEDDALGMLISDALIAKARQGVEVRIIYDDVGCWNVSHQFFERMREEGIEAVPFLPVRFPSFTSKVNYRNHRKLIVIDGLTGFIGGMNFAMRYVNGKRRESRSGKKDAERQWRDTMVQVSGGGVYSLQRAFLIDWYFVDRTLLSDRKYYPNNAQLNLQSQTSNLKPQISNLKPQTSNLKSQTSNLKPQISNLLQTVTSSPASPNSEIMQGFVRIILAAKHYVYIETPYFLPTEPVLFALKTAAGAGIDVRILVPRDSDAWFTEWASRSFLRDAAEAGVKVNLYTAGFLHSKLMVADDTICTCGSTNVDFRSFENNFEANAFFYGEDVAVTMKQMYLDDESRSVPLSDLPDRLHPRFSVRLLESLVRLLSPLM